MSLFLVMEILLVTLQRFTLLIIFVRFYYLFLCSDSIFCVPETFHTAPCCILAYAPVFPVKLYVLSSTKFN